MYERIEKRVTYALILILIVSMVPVMYLGCYNFPVGDDYFYSAETHNVWKNTGSIIGTIAEAIKGVFRDYHNWQGTYSALFLMHLAPNVFSDAAYHFVTATLLIFFVGSIFYLLKPIICKCLNSSTNLWLIVSSVLSIVCIQTVPTQGETFFWYNGSMYYTGFFSLTLFFLGIVIRYLLKPHWRYIPILLFLTLVIAGGNYVSLLPAILIVALLVIVLAYKRSYKQCGVIALVLLMLLIGLAISALAPGNAVRQAELCKIPAWKAILKSLFQGIRYMWAWMRGWWWITAAILTPFLIKSYKYVTWRFRYPIIVIGLAYGIFCSMSCPTFYSMNSTGPARVVSIVYYGFILMTFFCYYYLLGYIYQKCRSKDGNKLLDDKKLYKRIAIITPIIAIVLFVGQCFVGNIYNCTTVKSIKLLVSGEAKAYGQENAERLELLNDENVEHVIFQPHEYTPDMLYLGDLLDDPNAPVNQKMAQFYGKKSVIVDWSGK